MGRSGGVHTDVCHPWAHLELEAWLRASVGSRPAYRVYDLL